MAESTAKPRPKRAWLVSSGGVLLVGTLLVAAVIYFAGLIQNLPYSAETDEASRVVRAVEMVRRWDPNPGWFGHPASTVFYPLALLIYLYNGLALGGSFLQPNPELPSILEANQAPFYILGRLVTISYGLASLPLFYLVGRRLFSSRTALLGIWMSLTFTLVISNAQVVRSDSAALFFSLLSLWWCVRFYDQPTMANRLRCAFSIGLAVSSRYFMAAYVLPLAAAELALLRRSRQQGQSLVNAFSRAFVSPSATLAGFALSSPFFFLDFETALGSLRAEARTTHIGFDGLSPAGNFWWYASRSLPEAVTWPYLLLGILGLLLALRYRRHLQVLLGAFILAYLVGISFHPLHQQRWLIQIMPSLGLFSAEAVVFIHDALARRLALAGPRSRQLLVGLVLVVLAVPAFDMVLFEIRQVTPSTRVQAMRWMEENLLACSVVLQDDYGAALLPPKIVGAERVRIGEVANLDEYRRQGIDYLVVTDEIYDRFFNEPERYEHEVAIYTEIFTRLPLLREFEPSPVRPGVVPRANVSPATPGGGGGPVIRIYRLPDEGERGVGSECPAPQRYYAALDQLERLEDRGQGTTVYFHLNERPGDGLPGELISLGQEADLRVRIATMQGILLLDSKGDDHIYVLEETDLAAIGRLLQLGFVEMDEDQVALPNGRHGLRFFRLRGSTQEVIEANFPQKGPEVRLDNGLRLNRWQAPTDLRGQTVLPLAAAWEAWDQPKPSTDDPDWCMSQHLLDVEGRTLVVADLELRSVGYFKKGDALLTWSQLALPSDLQLQRSSLLLGMFSCWKRDMATALDENGKPASEGLRIGPFKVGGREVIDANSPPRFPAQVVLGGQIELNGYDASVQGGPGGVLRLVLHWRAENRPQADYTVFAQLLREGELVTQQDSQPRDGRYPTTTWAKGEDVVDEHQLALPVGLAAGEYRLIVGMYTLADMRRLPVVGPDGRPLGDFVDLGVLAVGPGGETAFRQH